MTTPDSSRSPGEWGPNEPRRGYPTSSVATNEKAYSYGYQWWLISRKGAGSHDAYAAWGYGGQLLIVVPELELISVFTSLHGKRDIWSEGLLPGVTTGA